MAALLIVLSTLLSYAIGWTIGVPLLLPILNTLASFPFMVLALKRGDLRLAVARMLLWALTMAVAATLLSYARPAQTDTLTGRGAESTPSQFIPQQAGHAVLFSALALVTGGVAAMPMGAVLMNYMGHYVGTLAAASRHPLLTMVLGWHPWAVIRVISFVVIGVVLSAPLLSRLGSFTVDRRFARMLLLGAGVGLVADIILKTLLAPAWQRLLLRVVGW
jgi:hypothetical protein